MKYLAFILYVLILLGGILLGEYLGHRTYVYRLGFKAAQFGLPCETDLDGTDGELWRKGWEDGNRRIQVIE